MHTRTLLASAVSGIALLSAFAWADLDGAKKELDNAKHQLEIRSYDDALSALDLAEAELEGITGADAMKKEITELRTKTQTEKDDSAREIIKRKLDRRLDDLKESIGNLATWSGAAAEMQDLLNSADAKKLLKPEDLETYNKKIATYAKLNAKKAGPQLKEQAQSNFAELEKQWAEAKTAITGDSPNSRESAIDDMTRAIEGAPKIFANLDPDDADTKTMKAKFDAINAEFTKLALADKIKGAVERINRYTDTYKDEFDGWDKESATITFEQYKAVSGDEKMSRFGYPKSAAYISRMDDFDEKILGSDEVKPCANTPEVKALADKVHADLAAAKAKILKNATAVIEQGEKSPRDDNSINAMSRLKDDVRLSLGENDADGKKLQARCVAYVENAEKAAAGADAAQKELIVALSKKSEVAWPAMAAKFKIDDGFDPNNVADFKGKTIKITTDNLMGYRFKPGDFAFATTLNGIPIAANFDPALAKALKEVESKIGRSVGDSDDDGKWEIIATVTGAKGRMLQRKQAEGDVKVDGETVGKVTAEYADPVEAPIITIIAARCGPFVGAKGIGTIKPDGSIGQ